MAHGTMGLMIPLMRTATSGASVTRLGYDERWFDYSMDRQVFLEEIEHILLFFQELF